METTPIAKLQPKIDLDKIDIRPIPRSKLATWIYYLYNTFLFINAFMTLVLTFIDDDWKESHNFDYITKILQWTLGALIFVWVMLYKVIPHIKDKHLKLKIEKQPIKIKNKIIELENKKQKLLEKIKNLQK